MMDDLSRMIRELFELRDIPIMTEKAAQQLTREGRELIDAEARRVEREIDER